MGFIEKDKINRAYAQLAVFKCPEGGFYVATVGMHDQYREIIFGATKIDAALDFVREQLATK